MSPVTKGLMRIDPLWPVIAAWRCGWSVEQLAQCYNNMPLSVAQELLEAQSPEDAAEILGVEFTE